MENINYDIDLLRVYSYLFKLQSCKKIYSIISIYINPICDLLNKIITIANYNDYDIYYEKYYDEILKYVSFIEKIITDNYSKEKDNNYISFEGWDLPEDLFSYVDIRRDFIDIMDVLKDATNDFYLADGALKYSKKSILLLLGGSIIAFDSFKDLLNGIMSYKLKFKNSFDEFIDRNDDKSKKK